MQFLGAALSSLAAGTIADKIGRKNLILLSNVGYIGGAVIFFMSIHWILLYLGRFIIGVAIGLSIVGCTLFLSESAPDSLRGQMTTAYWLMFCFGLIISNIMALILSGLLKTLLFLPVVPAIA